MRILVLHQHYWPEIAATAQLLTDLAEDLAAAGHEVRVVCGQPSYRMLPGEPAILPTQERRRGVVVERVPTYRPTRRGLVRRIAHYTSYFAASLPAALRPEADVVLALCPPPLLLGLSGTLAARWAGVPFVFVVEDLYPELAVELGALPQGSLARALERVARAVYARASRVVAISTEMGARLEAAGVARARLAVIHNWADTREIVPLARQTALSRALSLDARFVVLYAGNVSSTLGLAALPEAAERLRDRPVSFVVAGEGDARPGLEAEAKARALSQMIFVPPRPRDELAELLATADVGLVTTRRGERGLRFPSKLFGVMASGRPVLAAADPGSELASIVERSGCGLVVTPEDPEALAAGVRALYEAGPETRAAMGRRGRTTCEREFTRSVATQRYRSLLEELVGSPHTARMPAATRPEPRERS
ncbi:MAG: glycosyltransferase family 4 protein [Sandaracinaceae bacterium]